MRISAKHCYVPIRQRLKCNSALLTAQYSVVYWYQPWPDQQVHRKTGKYVNASVKEDWKVRLRKARCSWLKRLFRKVCFQENTVSVSWFLKRISWRCSSFFPSDVERNIQYTLQNSSSCAWLWTTKGKESGPIFDKKYLVYPARLVYFQ